ncbi:ketoacyl-ACP synthase III family protein [Streptomyces sp. NPDC001393]
MRFDKDLFVASAGSWLPDTVTVRQATADGLVDEEHQNLGFEHIAVSDELSGPEMAVRAGRLALERSGVAPQDVGLVLHSSGSYQGHDMWPAAAYVANETVGRAAPGFDLQQRCNAALGSLSLAAGYIGSGLATEVLMTTGDRFAAPWVDRWNVQLNLIFADGGTALMLSGRGGFARLLAATIGADNSLERWNRGLEPFGIRPGAEVRLIERGMQHAATKEAEGSWERYEAALMATTSRVLAEAGVTTEDISRVVTPHVHRNKTPENYDLLGFTEKQSTWEVGRRYGHIGPGDQFLGIEHLVLERAVGPGDLVLVVAAGAGFSFSAAVLEILHVPSW